MDFFLGVAPLGILLAVAVWLIWRGMRTAPDSRNNKSGQNEDFRYYGPGRNGGSFSNTGSGEGD